MSRPRRSLFTKRLLSTVVLALAVVMLTPAAASADVYQPPGSGNSGGGGGIGRGTPSCTDGSINGRPYFAPIFWYCRGYGDFNQPNVFAYSGFDTFNFYATVNKATDSAALKYWTMGRVNPMRLGEEGQSGLVDVFTPTPIDAGLQPGAYGRWVGYYNDQYMGYPQYPKNFWAKNKPWPIARLSNVPGLMANGVAPGIGDCRSLTTGTYAQALSTPYGRPLAYQALWYLYHRYYNVVSGGSTDSRLAGLFAPLALQLTNLTHIGSGPQTISTPTPVLDDVGNPVLDENGNPRTTPVTSTVWPDPPVWNPTPTCSSAAEFAAPITSPTQVDVVTCVMPTARYARRMFNRSEYRYTPFATRGGERYWAYGAYSVPQYNLDNYRAAAAAIAFFQAGATGIKGAYGDMYGTNPNRSVERQIDNTGVGPAYAFDAVRRFARCWRPILELGVPVPTFDDLWSPDPDRIDVTLSGPDVLHANGGLSEAGQRTFTGTPGKLVCVAPNENCKRQGVAATTLKSLKFKVQVTGTGGYRDCGTSPDPGTCDFWIESTSTSTAAIQKVTDVAGQFYRATTGGQVVSARIIDASATAEIHHAFIYDPGNGAPRQVTIESKVVPVRVNIIGAPRNVPVIGSTPLPKAPGS